MCFRSLFLKTLLMMIYDPALVSVSCTSQLRSVCLLTETCRIIFGLMLYNTSNSV